VTGPVRAADPAQPNSRATLDDLRRAAARCANCDLYRTATQTVFGEGPGRAQVVLVGEQPGDHEDEAGRPFVGPAGRVLDEALQAANLDRDEVYVTNAVKHFRWVPRGKKRIHQQPNRAEIRACRPWLEDELTLIAPRVLVLVGAVATQSLLGFDARVSQLRGRWVESAWAPNTLVTVHPSAILRQPDGAARREAFAGLVADLSLVSDRLSRTTAASASSRK
jgi:DNA polymerase